MPTNDLFFSHSQNTNTNYHLHDANPSVVVYHSLRASISVSDAAQAARIEGQEQLTVLARQSAISRLYPSAQSVMEAPTAMA